MHGDLSALDTVRSSAEFLHVVARAGAVVDKVGVVTAHTGEALARVMGIYGEVSQGLPQAT
jgi:hypothetical protein